MCVHSSIKYIVLVLYILFHGFLVVVIIIQRGVGVSWVAGYMGEAKPMIIFTTGVVPICLSPS